MKKTIIIFLILTGTFIFNSNSQDSYYTSYSNSTNLYYSRMAPPKTGVPNKREAGITASNLEIC